MSTMSAADAAFYGFGLIKRDPLTFLGVALIYVGFVAAVFSLAGPAYMEFFELALNQAATGEPLDDAVALAAMSRVFGALAAIYALMIPMYALVLGALHRSLVHGRSRGWILGVRLGLDEVRVFIVSLACYILIIIPYFLGTLIGVAVALTGASTGGGAWAAAFPIGIVAGICFTVWIAVRLSCAGPATIGEQKFVIFESWEMTKGRFWTIFLAYLLLIVVTYVVYFALMMGLLAVAFPTLSMLVTPEGAPDLAALETVNWMVWLVVGSIVYAVLVTFYMAGMIGVGARAYLDWKQNRAGEPAAPAGASVQ